MSPRAVLNDFSWLWAIGFVCAGWILIGVLATPVNSNAKGESREQESADKESSLRFNEHWAFMPVGNPEIPEVSDSSWPANPLDHFVLARLESRKIMPSPEADRRILIRRVHFDLIGLPPSFDEVEMFVNDPSPNAFAELADRLLARPEYGERWARHWLDVARYADAKGYVDAGEPRYPFAYTYRDYVIGAFNEDLPFDRFVLEQLAADQIVNGKTVSSLAALGFLTVGSRYNFFPHEIIDDRIDVVTRGFMGLSVACARCHDHKFDPISSEDYYGLYGIFANSQEPTPADAPRLQAPGPAEDSEFSKKVEEASEKYAKLRNDLHRKIMHEMRAWAGDYLRYVVQSTPEHRTMAQAELRTKRGLIREVSAYSKGGVVRWRSFLSSRKPNDPVFGFWARMGALKREAIADECSSQLSAWCEIADANPIVVDAFTEKTVTTMADVADIYGVLLEETDELWRTQQKDIPDSSAFEDCAREELRQVLYGPEAPGTVTLDQSENLYTLDESVDARKHFANIERVFLKAWDDVAPRPMMLVDRKDPIEQHVFLRGDPQRPGALVKRRIPAILDNLRTGPVSNGSGRLEFARAIVHPKNPLTARVIVNRIWAWHFGSGLVGTPSDFGLRSRSATHPDLLDFLANWFIKNGWSVKKLHRMILNSSTWRQATLDRPNCRALDPDNTLLWRMNRRRLDFEEIRDGMLLTSENLNRTYGGPPTRKSPDDVSHRKRTIYTYVDRERLPEICSVFDFPSPDITAPKRPRTTVPQQSLFLLNSPFVIAQAEAVARDIGSPENPDPGSERATHNVVRIYRRIYGRTPIEGEVELARDFLGGRLDHSNGNLETEDLNPWTDLAQALLLSNEFLFVD